MYILPKEGCTMAEIYQEFNEIFQAKFKEVREWKCKAVKRKYHFELPIDRGEQEFLKLKYSA